MLKQGLYEQVVNKEIKEELNGLSDAEKHIEKIDSAEASSILTQYLSEVVHKGLDRIAGDDISAQLELVNKIVGLISQETAEDDLQDLAVSDDGEQLLALLSILWYASDRRRQRIYHARKHRLLRAVCLQALFMNHRCFQN